MCCEASAEFVRSYDQISGKPGRLETHSPLESGLLRHHNKESCDKHEGESAYQDRDEIFERMTGGYAGAEGSRQHAGERMPQGEREKEEINNAHASPCKEKEPEGRVNDAGKPRESEHDPVVYSAPQHRGLRDAATVFCVAGVLVPVFTVSPLLIYYSWYQAACTHFLGGPVLTTVLLYIALAGAMWAPTAYSAVFKKVLLRPIMFELLSYVRSFKVLKEKKLADDKNYIFCWHPHGRLFYGFATFCGLFDAIVCPELGHVELFGGINDLMFSLPIVGVMLRLSGEACVFALFKIPAHKIDFDRRRGWPAASLAPRTTHAHQPRVVRTRHLPAPRLRSSAKEEKET